jgi:NAD-dependent SIR2 family protein deacetylase
MVASVQICHSRQQFGENRRMNLPASPPAMTVATMCDPAGQDALSEFVGLSRCLLVLTGAGISTASGIPGYRDAQGNWQRKPPVTHQEFMASAAVRRRYWARSMLGWPLMRGARPNLAHLSLARMEAVGRVGQVVTQNVDSLHGEAGSRDVIELHGRLREVRCMDCGFTHSRQAVQAVLEADNPAFLVGRASIAPDGDADLDADFDRFRVPCCTACGGLLKPDVVFYGDGVPKTRADSAMDAVTAADAVLVVGSTLMVRSGYRLCEAAHAAGKPIAAINIGRTRADPLLSLKLEEDCGSALAALAATHRWPTGP